MDITQGRVISRKRRLEDSEDCDRASSKGKELTNVEQIETDMNTIYSLPLIVVFVHKYNAAIICTYIY